MLSNHKPAAHVIGGNDDLLNQILLRLPIRSLIRFKSVSKHWLSLITNPTFSLPPNPPISGLFLHRFSRLIIPEYDFVPLNNDHPPIKPPFRTVDFFDEYPCGIRILQSCNGLLLCCCCTDQGDSTAKSNYFIYNPTTNKFTTLPDPHPRLLWDIHGIEPVCAVNLAFDPSKSPHYKAVCVFSSDTSPDRYEIEIYSSETGLWTPSGDPFFAQAHFRHPVYWNDSIHWINTWLEFDSLYFNLNTESIETMPMPPMPEYSDIYGRQWYPFAGESDGHLHLIVIHAPQTTHFNVYEMETDYSEWFVKYHVDLDSLPIAFPEMIRSSLDPSDVYYYAFVVMDVVRGEKDEDSFLVLQIPGKAMRYNFMDKTFNKLCDFSTDETDIGVIHIDGFVDFWGWIRAFQFIESLASV